MTNKPKILSNELDQVPKIGERYEKELNNPEVHDQIVESFDESELEIMEFDLAQKIANYNIESLNKNYFGVKKGLGDIYILLHGIYGNNSSKARDVREKIIYDKDSNISDKFKALGSASGICNEKVDKAFDFLFSFVKNESNSEKQKKICE